MVFWASFADFFAHFAVKFFLTAKIAKDLQSSQEIPTPRVQVETPAPPGFARSHWKGNSCRDVPACLSLF